MMIIDKNEGLKIAYTVDGSRITFGDELTLNLTKYQRDWPVTIDICRNKDNMLVIGIGAGLHYVAQISIPAIEYTTVELVAPEVGGGGLAPEQIPLDMIKVTLTLWSLVNPTSVII